METLFYHYKSTIIPLGFVIRILSGSPLRRMRSVAGLEPTILNGLMNGELTGQQGWSRLVKAALQAWPFYANVPFPSQCTHAVTDNQDTSETNTRYNAHKIWYRSPHPITNTPSLLLTLTHACTYLPLDAFHTHTNLPNPPRTAPTSPTQPNRSIPRQSQHLSIPHTFIHTQHHRDNQRRIRFRR